MIDISCRLLPFVGVALLAALAMGTQAAAAPAARSAVRPLPPAPEGVLIEQNVAYLAPGREEKLDLYLPANRPEGTRSPGIVWIHGGGWTGGDKSEARAFNICTTLAQAGYVCVSINYQMERGKLWPTNLLDCKNAVRFLRHHADRFGVDVKHIGVMGGSAGGHLALMVGYTTGIAALEPQEPYPGVSDAVQAVVNMYGITNPATRQRIDAQGNPTGQRVSSCALVEGKPEENPEAWQLVSPVYHARPGCPPTLILHGMADATVDRDQATELAAKLKQVGVEHELVMVEGIGHTFDLQNWGRKPLPRDLRPTVLGFLDKHLKR